MTTPRNDPDGSTTIQRTREDGNEGEDQVPVTWPTEFANATMQIPPATAKVVVEGSELGQPVGETPPDILEAVLQAPARLPERAPAYVDPETGESNIPTPPNVTPQEDEQSSGDEDDEE